MPLDKRPNAEPIRGYRLIEKLGAGGFGEVWKCEAPGGIHKAIKFVFGNLHGLDADSKKAEEELRAVQLIKSIRHPFLLSIDRVENIQGELVIVTELADQNLHERWQKYHARGLAGMPRDELLGYLHEAAEVLDLLNEKFDLQHLDVKPQNLFLVCNHIKVADFGLVNSLAAKGSSTEIKLASGAVTPLYAAPELFHGMLSRQCDQYSLAIVFLEMLTGTLPYPGKNTRQLLLQHTQGEPDLRVLSAGDRAVVARALAKKPEDRFASCLEFVRALQSGSAAVPRAAAGDTDPDLVTTPPPHANPTVTLPRAARATPPTAPALPPGLLDGYRFLERIGISELLEVWKVQAPDGKKKRLQILFGFHGPEKTVKEAVQRLRSVHHPALIAPAFAHVDKGRLLLLTDSFRDTVRDRFRQCQQRKQPGIARAELIDYLRAAAEVLDYLYQQHGVQHLNLNPRNLVLDHGWLQVAEFGYAQMLWLPEGQDVARRNGRYAAPELFGPHRPRACDQYSLAVIYAEMLSGVHPFRGQSPETYAGAGRASRAAPDLARLPDLDREVIGRALDPDPLRRWPCCTDMFLALEGTSLELNQQLASKPDSFVQLLEESRGNQKLSIYTGASPADLNQVIADIITSAGGHADPGAVSAALLSADENTLQHTFQAGLPIGTARGKLEDYARELAATIKQHDDHGCVLHLQLPTQFWQHWLGRQPGLEIDVRLARVNPMSATPIEVTTRVRAVRCSAKQGRDLVEQMGAGLIDALQKHLLINSEKRVQDRLLWPHDLTVTPLHAGGRTDDPIVCRAKDISHTGIGFYLPHELETADVLIELPSALHGAPVAVPATLVRAKRCPDGWYEVGALFRVPAARKSPAEICI